MGALSQPVRVVCATRLSEAEFLRESALGRSLSLQDSDNCQLQLYPNNRMGLGQRYNHAIEDARGRPAALVFVHDDVWLGEKRWSAAVLKGLQAFDVIGVAGNRRRLAKQPAWAFIDQQLSWDEPANLSGKVGRGKGDAPCGINDYGASSQSVKLLDGLLLAADSRVLLENEVRFDPVFQFHFYDMDFCRSCERKDLRMGTWPISVVHESGGDFGSLAWKVGYVRYLNKWGE